MKILILFTLISYSMYANREYGINDYNVIDQGNRKIIVDRWELKLVVNNKETVLFDSRNIESDESYFIRDFDIANDNKFYLTVGSRYIGFESSLHISSDNGLTWNIDTSYYTTIEKEFNNSPKNVTINQIEILDGNVVLMLLGYYESGIIYSLDKGKTWSFWFKNLITYYNGILECGTDYYLFGFEGDGFSPSMIRIEKDSLLNSDVTSCVNRDNIDCIYAPNSLNKFEQYKYFKSYVDSVCVYSSVGSKSVNNLDIYPNPANELINLKISNKWSQVNSIEIFNSEGKLVRNYIHLDISSNTFDVSTNNKGIYFLKIHFYDGSILCYAFVKE